MATHTEDTDDFFTYNSVTTPGPVVPKTSCKCMYHWGEYAQTRCDIDPKITESNIKTLENSY